MFFLWNCRCDIKIRNEKVISQEKIKTKLIQQFCIQNVGSKTESWLLRLGNVGAQFYLKLPPYRLDWEGCRGRQWEIQFVGGYLFQSVLLFSIADTEMSFRMCHCHCWWTSKGNNKCIHSSDTRSPSQNLESEDGAGFQNLTWAHFLEQVVFSIEQSTLHKLCLIPKTWICALHK